MVTAKNPNPESLELQAQRRRDEEFSRLPPEEQARIRAEEREKRRQAQERLNQAFYGNLLQDTTTDDKPNDEPQTDKAKPLDSKNTADNHESETPSVRTNNERREINLERFLILFDAAVANIDGNKPFGFDSAALDDFGNMSTQNAYMRRLIDHSQMGGSDASGIRSRLENKKTRPEQISLDIEIDMGERKHNSTLGLTNITLRLSLASLMEGGLSEKLTHYTNLVYYAVQLHTRQKQLQTTKPDEVDTNRRQTQQTEIDEQKRRFALGELSENGSFQQIDGLFAQSTTNTVAFSCNNGSIWGTFDSHGAAVNRLELQEALDKISIES